MTRIFLAMSLGFATFASAQEPGESRLAENYGFLPVEVTKLSERSSNLLAGDFNDDGRQDLVLIDNQRHRLDLLIQRSDPQPPDQRGDNSNPNRIENHGRFEHRKLPVDENVVALVAADLNHDGRVDLAYFGTPDQLVIRIQSESGNWQPKRSIRLPDVAAAQWCMAAGDLNGDGRADLVVLGKSDTLLLMQNTSGEFDRPTRLLNTSSQLGMVQVADLNNDGADDLCYLAGDAARRSLGIRLQTSAGELGPEYLFDLKRPRAVSVRDVDGDGSAEILTIDSRTGRLEVLKFVMSPPTEKSLTAQLVRFGFGQRSAGRDRDIAIGDFDGNDLTDVIVSDPDASRVLMFRQWPDRGLDLGTPFPGLAGGGQIRTLPGQPGDNPKLVVHSSREKSIALSEWKEGRLTFPRAIPLSGEPLAMELLPVPKSTAYGLAVLTREKDGRSSNYRFQGVRSETDDASWETVATLSGLPEGPLELRGTPDQLMLTDVTGDGRKELLVFQGSQPPQVLRASDEGVWSVANGAGAWGTGTIPPGAVFPGKFGQESGLLVAQQNFVRLLRVNSAGDWEVVDQVNAGESRAEIVGTAMLNYDGQPGNELVMIDRGVGQIRIFQYRENRFQSWLEVELGELDYQALRVADLNHDGRDDLLLLGADQFAVLYAGGATPELRELATYETPFERSFPTDILAGDLNGDRQTNLVMTDTRGHMIEILEFRPPSQLERAMYFTVFEEKGFAREEGSGIDPREGVIADVTGDGLSDLVLLVHDRVLVYPQDSGTR